MILFGFLERRSAALPEARIGRPTIGARFDKNAYAREYMRLYRQRNTIASIPRGRGRTNAADCGEECATPDRWVEGLPCAVPLEPEHDRGAVADVEAALAGPRVPRRSNRWVLSWMRDL